MHVPRNNLSSFKGPAKRASISAHPLEWSFSRIDMLSTAMQAAIFADILFCCSRC